jgi:hypothetical protein
MGNKRAHPPAPSATQVRREQSADLEAEEEEADQQRGNEVELDEVSQAFRPGRRLRPGPLSSTGRRCRFASPEDLC